MGDHETMIMIPGTDARADDSATYGVDQKRECALAP